MTSKTPKTAIGSQATSYVAPSTGIFRIIPASWVPYAELMRLDRPAGYYAFYWHYAIGIAFAACISSKSASPGEISGLAGYLAVWVLVFRGAVCTWNDNIDQEFDRLVARCRNRPIARGAVSTAEAHVFTIAQTAICAAMLFPFPAEVWAYAAAMTIMLAIYPFGKRITDFPQVILGFAFAIPIFMCPAAMGADPIAPWLRTRFREYQRLLLGASSLYLAQTVWTITFDTVYAHQDIEDDIKAGVKSLAVRLGDRTKLGLGVLSATQIGLLMVTGSLCGLGWSYLMLGCGGAGLSLVAMLALVHLEKPSSCAWWFGPGSRLVGSSIVLGLASHYFLQVYC